MSLCITLSNSICNLVVHCFPLNVIIIDNQNEKIPWKYLLSNSQHRSLVFDVKKTSLCITLSNSTSNLVAHFFPLNVIIIDNQNEKIHCKYLLSNSQPPSLVFEVKKTNLCVTLSNSISYWVAHCFPLNVIIIDNQNVIIHCKYLLSNCQPPSLVFDVKKTSLCITLSNSISYWVAHFFPLNVIIIHNQNEKIPWKYLLGNSQHRSLVLDVKKTSLSITL